MIEITLVYLVAGLSIAVLTYLARRNRRDPIASESYQRDPIVAEAPHPPAPAANTLLHLADLIHLHNALSAEEVRHVWVQLQHQRR